jgi:hypothetical protein
MRHLQGDLQAVFDALYDLGVIEPVLAMDWRTRLLEIEQGSPMLESAILAVNECGRDRARLTKKLNTLDQNALEMLAMEVAREFADYHTRQDLH